MDGTALSIIANRRMESVKWDSKWMDPSGSGSGVDQSNTAHHLSARQFSNAELSTAAAMGLMTALLLLYWNSEADVYAAQFLLSNGLLALVGSGRLRPTCKLEGLLCQFALALGFESLYQSQSRGWQLALRRFRLFRPGVQTSALATCWIGSLVMAVLPWEHYRATSRLAPTLVSIFYCSVSFLFLSESAFVWRTAMVPNSYPPVWNSSSVLVQWGMGVSLRGPRTPRLRNTELVNT